ncbi:MAG TPA: class I SAM-dependent methyltransferase [Geobacteraceae bacterium]|nr:class I SAM-dependent methyltransferase [Geobacteraceae bacterium]
MGYEGLAGAVHLAHFFLRERVGAGDRVADATCGNGHDTLFLARLVGPCGRVWAFDLQEQALANTRALLDGADCLAQTELVAAGHERMAEFIDEPLKAVLFNLGYLPGGDRDLVTRPEGTLAGLDQASHLLLPGGIITVCVYTGHPGGEDESKAVNEWAAGLSPREFNTWVSRQANRGAAAPYLVFIENKLIP